MPLGRPLRVAVLMSLALAAGTAGCRAVQAQAPSADRQLTDAIRLMESRGDYRGAITLLEQLSNNPDRAVAARALLFLGTAYEKLGRAQARQAYEQVLKLFPDQPQVVAEARARLAVLDRASAPRPLTPAVRRPWERQPYGPIGPPTPDGRYLPGVDWDTGNLVLRQLATGKDRAVTAKETWQDDGGGYAGAALVSPDGSRIAYAWYPSGSDGLEFGELRVSRVNGRGRHVVRRTVEEAITLGGWTPDGTKVLACLHARDWTTELALVDIQDGRIEVLASFRDRLPDAALSPDGRYVAYAFPEQPDGISFDIHILDVATKREVARMEGRANDRSPVWLADGRHLLFMSNRAGNTGLWMTGVEHGRIEGDPLLLRSNLGRAGPIGVTDDGTLYYSAQTGLADIFTSTLDPSTGRWSAPAILPVEIEGSNQFPAFSPDGRFLAYISRRGDSGSFNEPRSQAVVVHDLENGEERTFLPAVSFPVNPRWSPDGRSLVFVGNIQTGIQRLDVATGEFTTIVQRPRGWLFGLAEWARDGRSLYYAVGGEVRRHDFTTGADTTEYGAPALEWIGYVLPSHDGQFLAFSHSSGPNMGLYVTTPSFTGPKAVLTIPAKYYAKLIGWSADDRELFYFQVNRNDRTERGELWRVPAQGGRPQPLGLAVRGMWSPAISPDGRTVAFNVGSHEWETWVLEHIVPPTVASAKGQTAKAPAK